jgi:DNA-binding transcriptional ArsR family regulator
MGSNDHAKDNALLAALSHPLRRRILRVMEAENPISPRELSLLLKHPLPNVSYHVRVLADCEAVALVFTEPVRGSMQHFYRASLEAPWARKILELERRGDEAAAGETPTS